MFVPATSGTNKSNSIIKLSLLFQQKRFINKPKPMFALEYSKENIMLDYFFINQNKCLLLQLQEQTNLTVLLNNYFCTLNAKPYGLKRVVQTVKTI